MLTSSEQGCLLIADITGCTGYLAGSELEHAQDVPPETHDLRAH
jgi:hypothetical protein